MTIRYPDYQNCITNLAGSILREFGVETCAGTLALCDEWFQKKYKNIVVLLLVGLGLLL